MKSRKTKIQFGAAIIMAFLETNAHALDPGRVDDQQGMTLRSFMANGSGCSVANKPDVKLDKDGNLDINLFGMHAQGGPGIPPRDNRVNCQVTLDIQAPTGYTYEMASISRSGYVSLDRGVSGIVKTSAYFQASGMTLQDQAIFSGSVDKDFVQKSTIGASHRLVASCNIEKPLNINISVRVSNRSASNGLGHLILDGKQSVKFVMKKCSP